jgi:hypothetical protein
MSPPVVSSETLSKHALYVRQLVYGLADASSDSPLLKNGDVLMQFANVFVAAATKTTDAEPDLETLLSLIGEESDCIVLQKEPDLVAEGSVALCSNTALNLLAMLERPELHPCNLYWLRKDAPGLYTLVGYIKK